MSATGSCASVPQEAVVLSDFVGMQIAEHRASHEEFVRRYFEQSRDIVETFLRDRWIPEFLEDFVDRSGVVPLLVTPDEVLPEDDVDRLRVELGELADVSPTAHPDIIAAVGRAFGDAGRGQIMLEFAEAALAQIGLQRAELLEPLDAQEQEVLRHLSRSYAQLQQAQAGQTAEDAIIEIRRILATSGEGELEE